MCGIVGIINKDGRPVEFDILSHMAETLNHRGPDDEGHLVDGSVGFYHKRLSIIDLVSGHQPMTFGPVSIVFNGEMVAISGSDVCVRSVSPVTKILGNPRATAMSWFTDLYLASSSRISTSGKIHSIDRVWFPNNWKILSMFLMFLVAPYLSPNLCSILIGGLTVLGVYLKKTAPDLLSIKSMLT